MPVFKAFFAIAKKRRNAALIYLGIYAVITLLLSALSQDSINENFKASQRSIAITDEDNTDASRALCDYLASIHQVTTPEPGEDTALLDAIYYRTLNYAMVIPEGFEDRVLAGESHGGSGEIWLRLSICFHNWRHICKNCNRMQPIRK